MWKTLKGYFWWTHKRGSFHYDVMVTLILAFLFISPHLIAYRDKPVENTLPAKGGSLEVLSDGADGYVYVIPAQVLHYTGPDDAERKADVLRVVQPISGDVTVQKVEPVLDEGGNFEGFRAWVKR